MILPHSSELLTWNTGRLAAHRLQMSYTRSPSILGYPDSLPSIHGARIIKP
jgi:hypothetical protein